MMLTCQSIEGLLLVAGSAGLTRAVLEFADSVPDLMEQQKAAFLQIYTDKVDSPPTPHCPLLCVPP